MPITIPKIDAEDEDTRVADAIAATPPETTDRNPSSIEVKLLEGLGTFYGMLTYFADQLSDALKLKVFERVGLHLAAGEQVVDLEARATDAFDSTERSVSAKSFEQMAEGLGGVLRARATGNGGVVVVHLVADDLNETLDAPLREGVRATLKLATAPGIVVVTNQYSIRLVALDTIEIKFEQNADKDAVLSTIVDTFSTYVSAPTWPWGESLWGNELVSMFSQIQGVARVGDITVQFTDDYGATWSTVTLAVGAPITPSAPEAFGILHDGKSYPGAPTATTVTLI